MSSQALTQSSSQSSLATPVVGARFWSSNLTRNETSLAAHTRRYASRISNLMIAFKASHPTCFTNDDVYQELQRIRQEVQAEQTKCHASSKRVNDLKSRNTAISGATLHLQEEAKRLKADISLLDSSLRGSDEALKEQVIELCGMMHIRIDDDPQKWEVRAAQHVRRLANEVTVMGTEFTALVDQIAEGLSDAIRKKYEKTLQMEIDSLRDWAEKKSSAGYEDVRQRGIQLQRELRDLLGLWRTHEGQIQKSFDDKFGTLEKQNQQLTVEINQLREDATDKTQQNEDLQSQVSKLKEHIAGLEKRNTKQKSELEMATKRAEDAESVSRANAEALSQMRPERDSLRTKVDELERSCNEKTKQARDQSTRREQDIRELKGWLYQHCLQRNSFWGQHQSIRAQLTREQNEHQVAKNQLFKAQTAIGCQAAKILKLQKEKNGLRTSNVMFIATHRQHETALAGLQARIENETQRVRDKTAALTQSQEQLRDVRTELSAAQAELSAAEEEITTHKRTINELQSEKSALEAKNSTLAESEDRHEVVRNSLSSLKRKCEDLESDKNETKSKLQKYQADATELQEKLDSVRLAYPRFLEQQLFPDMQRALDRPLTCEEKDACTGIGSQVPSELLRGSKRLLLGPNIVSRVPDGVALALDESCDACFVLYHNKASLITSLHMKAVFDSSTGCSLVHLNIKALDLNLDLGPTMDVVQHPEVSKLMNLVVSRSG